MAYDRYDTRRGPREQSRDPERFRDREGSGRGSERGGGFFERAGEQISSWFGDDDDDDRSHSRDRTPGREPQAREPQGREPQGWGSRVPSDRDYRGHDNRGGEYRGNSDDRFDRGDRGSYRPVTGDYGRSEGMMTGGGMGGPGRGEVGGWQSGRQNRSDSNPDHDEYRRTSFAGSSERGQHAHDPHYHQWRQRQIDELDRDYDEYRREHQSKFENDFGSWRSQRQTKRQMLGQIREHMDVVGSDDEHVGKVDRVAGDRIILTKSDETAGGVHHSLSCTDIERVEGDRVILSSSGEQARKSWRDENRERALSEREDQGEAGPHILDHSFSGTYRS
jgi:hypothetical protein